MGKLIDADKLLAWLKIREGEAYTNADQVFNPSFLLGKADAFNDVVEYVKSGHSDLVPSPTIKPGDKKEKFFKGYNPQFYFRTEENNKKDKELSRIWTKVLLKRATASMEDKEDE